MIAKKRRKKKKEDLKNTIFLIFLGLTFLVLLFLSVYSNIRISKKRSYYLQQIKELKKEIEAAKKQKEAMQKILNRAESREYLEEIAREQFGLKAPGENVVIVSKEEEDNLEGKKGNKQEKEKIKIWDPRTWILIFKKIRD